MPDLNQNLLYKKLSNLAESSTEISKPINQNLLELKMVTAVRGSITYYVPKMDYIRQPEYHYHHPPMVIETYVGMCI